MQQPDLFLQGHLLNQFLDTFLHLYLLFIRDLRAHGSRVQNSPQAITAYYLFHFLFIYRFIIALESLPSPRVSPRLWLLSGCRLVRPCSGSRPRLFRSKLAVSVYGGCSDRSDLRYPIPAISPGPSTEKRINGGSVGNPGYHRYRIHLRLQTIGPSHPLG